MKSLVPTYVPEVLPDALAMPLRERGAALLGRGALALGRRPGRMSDLASDLAAVRAFGITAVFALVPEEPEEPRALAAAGIAVVRFPVADFGIPADRPAFAAAVADVAGRIRMGGRVLVFCGMGFGRTGMAAACVLVTLGAPAYEAVSMVRANQPRRIETDEQLAFVRGFASEGRRGL